jgi:predicted Zn-dependent protease
MARGNEAVPASASPARSTKRTAVAAAILLVAASAAWGVILLRQYRAAPAQRHIDAAMQYSQQRLGREAEREWRAAVRLDPDNAAAWEQLGELYFSTRNWVAAVEPFQQLRRLKPDAPHVCERLAACTLRSGDEVSALRYAEEELKRDPNNIGALAIAATLLADTGDDTRRLEYLRRLARLRPDDPDFLAMLAAALTGAGLYAEARPVLGHLLERAPDSAVTYLLRGRGWLEGDPSPQGLAQAEADLKRALALRPGYAAPHLYLGRIYRRRGQPARALPELEKAARGQPDRSDVYFELAGLYQQMGRADDAARARARFEALRQEADLIGRLEQRCAVDPNDFDDHKRMGLLALRRGDDRRASHYLNRAQKLRPEDADVRAALQQLASRLAVQ